MKLLLLLVLLCISVCSAQYSLAQAWSGNDLINNWVYYSGSDPTHGYVYFPTKENAFAWNYVYSPDGNTATIRCDDTTVSSGSGRGAVRLNSPQSYNRGVFVFDMGHMPYGAGTWPAIWTANLNNWPYGGEIDIIEGVNWNTQNQMTLHAQAGCTVPTQVINEYGQPQSGDCSAFDNNNAGCSIIDPFSSSYGQGFNNQGGAVIVMQWEQSGVYIWQFAHGSVPADINNQVPNPANWGEPRARFTFGQGCSSSDFSGHQLIFDLTFCGDWAGSVYPGGTGACNSYVQNNPGAFSEAYWEINSVKVYQ